MSLLAIATTCQALHAAASRMTLSRRGFAVGATLISASLSGQPAQSTPGPVEDTITVQGRELSVQRYVEADVGMTFPKTELTDKLFAQPWPAEWPFPDSAFARQDETSDGGFYAQPRFVYHIDEGAVRALTHYYRNNVPGGSAILDICSSWVSHYPEDFSQRMGRISGTGMNALELEGNKQLSDFTLRDLNVEPALPYEDGAFDVVTCVVSVDYLTKPLDIFREVRRVLKPGGKFILSQSNRCFPTKAIRMWLGMDDMQHCLVIGAYFHYAGGFDPPRAFDVSPQGPGTHDPLYIVEATKSV